jgi:YgiT-type zinc finger domain-containing protein
VKSVYSASNLSLVSILQSVLDEHGIRSWIRNEYLSAGVGELPAIDSWPQLCVEDKDFEEATRIVEEAVSVKQLPGWKCPSCGEELEGQFTECWNCGKSRLNE